ncbi:hypothetical protein [Cyclobacterium roseum]|uniref:hypothetical protein n=1 Tax=Cyclobacterium roseum TaxID=2666137 RepID=UPI001390994A|nr:hypothetical protein [Cyclobacterium roseum]
MKDKPKKGQEHLKGKLSQLNNNPDENEKGATSKKKKGILSKMNGNPDKKK